jgi:Domain of unknown function (DUF4189)
MEWGDTIEKDVRGGNVMLHLRLFTLMLFVLGVPQWSRADTCNCYAQCPFGSAVDCMSRCQNMCDSSAAQIRSHQEQVRETQERDAREVAEINKSNWYGAIAIASDQKPSASYDWTTRSEAKQEALGRCAMESPGATCRVTHEFMNQCAAVAGGDSNDPFVVMGTTTWSKSETADRAVKTCKAKTSNCRVWIAVCSTATQRLADRSEQQDAVTKKAMDVMTNIVTNIYHPGAYDSTPAPQNDSPIRRERFYLLTMPAGMGQVRHNAPDPRPALIAKLKELTEQHLLGCDYGLGRIGSDNEVFVYWFDEAPANLKELRALDETNSLRLIGDKGITKCPATFGMAAADKRAALELSKAARENEAK